MKRTLEFEYEHYDHIGDMDVVDQVLVSEAESATKKAHAPHSNFSVGAAV